MKKVKSIHFVGIKGAGMTSLAVMAKQAGFNVTGSDIADVFITDDVLKKGRISVFEGFNKSHVGDVDLVIATGAHGGLNNIEVKEAVKKGIRVVTQGEAVGLFMKGDIFGRNFTGISVCGTNGKTTTTAMIATILKNANLNPSYLVGTSFVDSLGFAGYLGKGQYFVAEADEYCNDPVFDKTAKFLWQNPKILVITNIDFDHPDIYPSIKEVKEAFRKLVLKIPKDDVVIYCGDDANIREVIKDFSGNKISYGKGGGNDYVISDIKTMDSKTQFWLIRHSGKSANWRTHPESLYTFQETDDVRDSGQALRQVFDSEAQTRGAQGSERSRTARMTGINHLFKLSIFGEQNVLNATAAIIVGKYLDLSIDQLKKGILAYKGSKRRSECIGKLSSGALVFDDYGHNPTKILATLKAFREAFPTKRIVCIFQPHTYSRTRLLFEQFSRSFGDADTVIITNIYASLREKKDPRVSSKRLADAIRLSPRRSRGRRLATIRGVENVVFLAKLQDVVEYISKKNYGEDTVIITMGAGDVYKIGETLISAWK